MKKTCLSLLSLLLVALTSCGSEGDLIESENFKKLNKVTPPSYTLTSAYKAKSESNTDLDYFMNKTYPQIALNNDKNNTIYSPLSLYYALALLKEGVSDSQANNELNSLMSYSDYDSSFLKELYLSDHYKDEKKGSLYLHNSSWLNKKYEGNKEYFAKLANNYYSEGYSTYFDDEGLSNMVKWMNNNTENFLNIDKDTFSVNKDTVLALINTLYFNGLWEKEFSTTNSSSNSFYVEEGKSVSANYMYQNHEGKYFGNSQYEMAQLNFINGEHIDFIKPNKDIKLNDFIKSDDYEEAINNSLNSKKYVNKDLYYYIPRFSYQNFLSLKDTLRSLGVSKIFTPGSINNIVKALKDELYVGSIEQIAKIELKEEGVKAAAVTLIACETSAVMGESVEFNLNSPFIYVIRDRSNMPLFIGSVFDPSK